MAKMGKLIIFDGPDGAGKTTQMKSAENFLKDKGFKVLVTKEPGSPHIPANVELRRIALHNEQISAFERELVFMGDAAIHWVYMNKWLLEYDYVICDRGMYSHIVYQNASLAHGLLSSRQYKMVSKMIPECVIKPDHAIIFDVDFNVALKRIKDRGGEDVIEKLGEGFMKTVNEEYKKIKPGHKISIIDANTSPDAVSMSLKVELGKLIRRKPKSRL